MEIDEAFVDLFDGFSSVPSDYLTPNWDDAGKVHEWKNYIHFNMEKMWDEFTDREKMLIALMANEQALAEEWD